MMANKRHYVLLMKGNKMRHYHIVINPAGASGRTNHCWKIVKEELDRLHVEYQVHLSSLTHGIKEIIQELTTTTERVDIILIGGDGSMNLAINGIVNFEMTYLGLIPCGSGNDLAKSLGISRQPIECLHNILNQESARKLDVGLLTYHNRYDEAGDLVSNEVYSRRFNISSGIGYDAAICVYVQKSIWKKIFNALHIGKLIYLFVGARLIFMHDHFQVSCKVDDKEYSYDKLLFIATMNQPYEGGGFKFCPKANPSDEKLNLCIADGLGRIDFFRIFPYAMKGQHDRFQGVYLKDGKTVHIQTKKPVWVHTDGEVKYQSSSISYSLFDQKLNLLD